MTAWNDALTLGLLMIGVLVLWVGWVAWSFRERESEPARQRQASAGKAAVPTPLHREGSERPETSREVAEQAHRTAA